MTKFDQGDEQSEDEYPVRSMTLFDALIIVFSMIFVGGCLGFFYWKGGGIAVFVYIVISLMTAYKGPFFLPERIYMPMSNLIFISVLALFAAGYGLAMMGFLWVLRTVL